MCQSATSSSPTKVGDSLAEVGGKGSTHDGQVRATAYGGGCRCRRGARGGHLGGFPQTASAAPINPMAAAGEFTVKTEGDGTFESVEVEGSLAIGGDYTFRNLPSSTAPG